MSDRDLIASSVERFARRVLEPRLEALEHDPAGPIPAELVTGLRDLGLLELDADADGVAVLATAVEVLARSAAAPATLLLAHVLGRALAADGGASADEGARLYGFPLYHEVLGLEPMTVARAVGDELELAGRCELVVGAPVADALVIPVGVRGALELVVVSARASGVHVGEPLLTLGMRGCPTADVDLRQVRVAPSARLAAGPAAEARLRALRDRLRGPALAVAVGVLEASVRAATAYARERVQGGVAIAEHQEVRRILGGMLEDLALCRSAMHQLIDGASAGAPPRVADESLFTLARERAAHAAGDGVQLLGGYGYMEDYGQERRMRDAKQAQCLLGRTEAARQDAVATWLDDGSPL